MSKAVIAMFCITWLEVNAMALGIDGYLLAIAVAAISGLGGYAFALRRRIK